MLHLQQVPEGLRLLPEDADGAGAVADGGAQEEPEEASQDQLNLVDGLWRGLGLPLLLILLILGGKQVLEGRQQRLRQVLRRRANCLLLVISQPNRRKMCLSSDPSIQLLIYEPVKSALSFATWKFVKVAN